MCGGEINVQPPCHRLPVLALDNNIGEQGLRALAPYLGTLDNLSALRAFAWAAIATVIFWVAVGLYVAVQFL